MAIRVPVNPQTSPGNNTIAPISAGNLPDPSGFARGLESLGESLDNIARRRKQEQLDQDEFDLTNKFIQQNNDWQKQYADAQSSPDLAPGAAGFADNISKSFSEQRKTLVAQALAAGADVKAVRMFDRNLGSAQNKFYGDAVGFEQQQANAHAKVQAGDLRNNLSVHVLNNPGDVDQALEIYNQQIDTLPNLLPAEREVQKQQGRAEIFMPGAIAFAKGNPQQVIEALDPSRSLAKKNPVAGAVAPASGFQGVATAVAQHFGLKPEEVGAVMHLESGFDPNVKNSGGYLGLIQMSPANQAKFGLAPGATPEQWTKGVIGYLEAGGFKPGMGMKDLYSTILTGGPGHYDRKDSNGTSVNSVMADLNGKHMTAAKAWLAQAQPTQVANDNAPIKVDPDTGAPIPADYPAYPIVAAADTSQWDKRADGSDKGMGWLGLRQRPDGNVSSEISVGVEINGKEQEIPLMVPGLSKSEMDYLMTHNPDQEQNPNFIRDMPKSIMQKAEAFAKTRIDQGLSPFRQPGEGSPALEGQTASQVYKTTGAQDKTGIPILDVLNGQQRLQVLAEAENARNQHDANARAEAEVQHDNVMSGLKTTGSSAPRWTEQQYIDAGILPAHAHQLVGQEAAMAAAGPLIQGMATMNVADMQARVAGLAPRDVNSKTFEVDQQVHAAAVEAMNHNLALRKADPGAYVQTAFPELTKQLATAQTVPQQQRAYTAILNAFKQLGYPADQWSPVTKDQAEQLSTAYLNKNPQAKLDFLNAQFASLPHEMVRPFVTSLITANSKVGPSLGRDAFLYATLSGHPEFSAVMKDAMAGAEAAAADSSRQISSAAVDKSWRQLFPGNTGMNAAAAGNYKSVAADLYVNAGGHVPSGAFDPLDQNLWKESVRRALGGLKDNKDTGYIDNGMHPPTVLPPSVTRQEFENWTDHLTGAQMNQHSQGGSGAYNKFGKPVLIRDIQNYGTFVMQAPGQYAIQFQDGGFLLNNKGGQYIINVTPQVVRGR